MADYNVHLNVTSQGLILKSLFIYLIKPFGLDPIWLYQPDNQIISAVNIFGCDKSHFHSIISSKMQLSANICDADGKNLIEVCISSLINQSNHSFASLSEVYQHPEASSMTSRWWQNPDLKRCEFASSVMRSEWFRVQRPDTTAVPLCWWRTNWVWRAGASSSCCRTSTTNCCSTVSANTGWTGKVSLSERRHYWIESRKMYRFKVHRFLILFWFFTFTKMVSTLITAEWEFHCKSLTSRHQMMSSC